MLAANGMQHVGGSLLHADTPGKEIGTTGTRLLIDHMVAGPGYLIVCTSVQYDLVYPDREAIS
jgi:hypothetical protein